MANGERAIGEKPLAGPTLSTEELLREKRLQRNLKIVVATLGALILIGLGAVAVRVLSLATGPKGTGLAGNIPSTITTAAGEVALELPPGAKVISVAISGSRLAVHHESPAGTGIAVLDLDTGRRIADVKTMAGVPRN